MYEGAVMMVMVVLLAPLILSTSVVLQVSVGDTVVLKCPSNDDNHRFQFWELMTSNQMIGPTNPYDRDKYKYEVLTGTLTIRTVSSSEFGLYTCVCKHITNNSFHFGSVELIVKHNSEQIYSEETDPYANEYRIALLLIVLLVLVVLVLILYYISTDKSPRFSALADEETPDEAGPSSHSRLSDLDSHGVDTALPQPETFTDVRLNDSRI